MASSASGSTGFRGEAFAFDSPSDAVAAMVAALGLRQGARRTEPCPLELARGRVLAESACADRDSPAFDHSAMDGYAIRAEDVMGRTLPVVGEVRIGQKPPELPVGAAAIRIVTGAGVPHGADTIVKREDVLEIAGSLGAADTVLSITISPEAALRIETGQHIRRRAENASTGDVVLAAGTLLTAASIGTLASIGCAAATVYPRVRVAIITTGDELVSAAEKPESYQIRNANGPALHASLSHHPWMQVSSTIHVRDDGGSLDGVLQAALADADAVVLTGGVSMGHRDPVRSSVERAGGEVVFHGLPQRPGKPVLGAIVRSGDGASKPIFGLPGNPISALVTCTRLVVPVLSRCAGLARPPAPVCITLAADDGRTLGLWWHRLVRLNDAGAAELVDGHGSGDIIAGGRSDGFIEVPPGAGCASRSGAELFAFYPWPA